MAWWTIHVKDESRSRREARLTMFALAAFADEEGECRPGIDNLKAATRLGEEDLYRALAALEQSGELTKAEQGGRGRATVYKIMLGPNATTAPKPLPAAHPVQIQPEPDPAPTGPELECECSLIIGGSGPDWERKAWGQLLDFFTAGEGVGLTPAQGDLQSELRTRMAGITPGRVLHFYTPDKWTIIDAAQPCPY